MSFPSNYPNSPPSVRFTSKMWHPLVKSTQNADGSTQNVVEMRVAQLKGLVQNYEEKFEKKIHERIARLCGGIAIQNVGAQTQVELKDKKLRIEDALNASKVFDLRQRCKDTQWGGLKAGQIMVEPKLDFANFEIKRKEKVSPLARL